MLGLISLNRLPPRAAGRDDRRHYRRQGTASGRSLKYTIDRTDGVPLFVQELTKAVVESGLLTDAGDHYTAAAATACAGNPGELAGLALGPARPVGAGARGGADRRGARPPVLARADRRGGGPRGQARGCRQPQLDDALAQLVGAELIYRRGIPPDAEYTFKHALVQDAAYSTLLRSRRQQLHEGIAATLEGRFPEIVVAQPALLAHHCTEAGLNEKAVDYLLKAGRQAVARAVMTEAVAQLREGIGLRWYIARQPQATATGARFTSGARASPIRHARIRRVRCGSDPRPWAGSSRTARST